MRLRLVASAVAIALLSGCAKGGGGAVFPDAYLLTGDGIPAGLRLMTFTSEWSWENAKVVPRASWEDVGSDLIKHDPETLAAEVLEPGSRPYPTAIWVTAGQWKAEADASAAAQAIQYDWTAVGYERQEACRAVGDDHAYGWVLLRDGRVLVDVSRQEGAPHALLDAVVDALRAQAPGLAELARACG